MASHIVGFQQITISTAALSLTVPAGCNRVALRVDTNGIRWRDDGSAPTATVGIRMEATDPVFVYDGDMAKIQFIRQSADGVLNCCYYN